MDQQIIIISSLALMNLIALNHAPLQRNEYSCEMLLFRALTRPWVDKVKPRGWFKNSLHHILIHIDWRPAFCPSCTEFVYNPGYILGF